MYSGQRKEITLAALRCLLSSAAAQAVIYPLTSVDCVWNSGRLVEMERAEGKGGNEGLYEEAAALDGNWLRLVP